MRRGILERFRAAYGDRPFALLPPEWIEALLDQKPPHAARTLARDVALALSVCAQARLSARGPDREHQAAQRSRATDSHVDRGRDCAIRGAPSDRLQATARARAAALHRPAAQRCGPHGPSAYQGGVFTVRQGKTGAELADPGASHLHAVLDATPSEHLTFLVTATGKPYGGNAFSEQFRNWCDAAGLPTALQAAGLRKAACRRLAEAGCSVNEIMAISGHATMKDCPLHQGGRSGAAPPQCDARKPERRMKWKVAESARVSHFHARSAELMGLKMRRITRGASFDHLVGAGEQRRWHGDAKRLRGLEVDPQLIFGRVLHRKVGRLLALEDAIDIRS